jgi:hypothetical protein
MAALRSMPRRAAAGACCRNDSDLHAAGMTRTRIRPRAGTPACDSDRAAGPDLPRHLCRVTTVQRGNYRACDRDGQNRAHGHDRGL